MFRIGFYVLFLSVSASDAENSGMCFSISVPRHLSLDLLHLPLHRRLRFDPLQ